MDNRGSHISTLHDVREWSEGYPVEMWISKTGRRVLRAYNECQNNYTEIDIDDMVQWFKSERGRPYFDAT